MTSLGLIYYSKKLGLRVLCKCEIFLIFDLSNVLQRGCFKKICPNANVPAFQRPTCSMTKIISSEVILIVEIVFFFGVGLNSVVIFHIISDKGQKRTVGLDCIDNVRFIARKRIKWGV